MLSRLEFLKHTLLTPFLSLIKPKKEEYFDYNKDFKSKIFIINELLNEKYEDFKIKLEYNDKIFLYSIYDEYVTTTDYSLSINKIIQFDSDFENIKYSLLYKNNEILSSYFNIVIRKGYYVTLNFSFKMS